MSEAAEEIVLTEDEQKAASQGWSPKDQWKGDPEKWVDATTFLEKGEKIQAIRKERNDYLTREVRELRQLIVEQRDMAKKARLQGYEQALKDAQKKQREAVELNDLEAYDAAQAETERISRQYQEESKAEPQAAVSDPEFETWKDDNPWFDEEAEPDLFAYAVGISTRVQKETGLGGRKLYDEVSKRVKKTFPQKFGNPRRNDPGAVEVSAEIPAKKKSGKTFDDLPESAKASYSKLAKQFKFQGIEYSKDEYLSSYVWD